MNKTLVFTSFVLAFVLIASLVSVTSKQIALAVDLSSLKDKATSMLTGNNNNNTSNNNSTSSADNSTSSSSLTSGLKQKATNAIGNLAGK
jgi:hypothetical protein